MAQAFLLGRLIFGGFFLYNGLNLFLGHATAAQYAAAKGVPFAEVAVLVAGALIVFGGASILLGFQPHLGIAAIVVFLLGVSFPMHDFWAAADPATRLNEMVNFTKNMALMGSALMLAAIPQPWPYSVEARRRIFA